MPQVTVYVREEDLDAWKAIQRKSEFLSNAINGLSSNGRTEGFEPSNSGSSPGEPAKDKWNTAGKPIQDRYDSSMEAARALMTPGCCLIKETNCKHFKWVMESGEFINENTGERRG